MTLRNFFTGRAIVFSLLLAIGLGVYLFSVYFPDALGGGSSTQENPESNVSVVFTWKYEDDDALNPDGVPQTNVILEAVYPEGAVERKQIDTVPSSCSDLPELEDGSVLHATSIQCYGAGLGSRYKVTKGETAYLIQRKIFEEATPDYSPPPQAYEVVAEFPLQK